MVRLASDTAEPSVSVLPFRDLTSPAMDEEYFADGITEELIDRLSRTPGLRVMAPASSRSFKDTTMSAGEAGKALRVTCVLLDGELTVHELRDP